MKDLFGLMVLPFALIIVIIGLIVLQCQVLYSIIKGRKV